MRQPLDARTRVARTQPPECSSACEKPPESRDRALRRSEDSLAAFRTADTLRLVCEGLLEHEIVSELDISRPVVTRRKRANADLVNIGQKGGNKLTD